MSINATFWSFTAINQYVAAIPYSTNPTATGPYLWTNAGNASQFVRPLGSPGCRVGATVGQFLFLADLYQQAQQTFFTGDGSTTTFTGTLQTPIQDGGQILDQKGTIAASFLNGVVSGPGIASGTLNLGTGALTLTFSSAPATGDAVYAQYIQAAPYRVAWSAIGNPTQWPIPLTNAAIAAQSGIDDLDPALGPCMFVAGYPQYGIILQRFGITRASYIGGNVVWSFQPYEYKRGCIAHGAAIKVGPLVYFLADDGLWMTDGANVSPVGTAGDNSAGIDRWFWATINQAALESIRSGYDSTTRSLYFAIPTGSHVMPDTLLTYNLLAQRWTKSAIASETLWTADNGSDGSPGTRQILGIMAPTHGPVTLTGPPLTGYLETADLYDATGNFRLTSGAIPFVECTDSPIITVGNRDSLAQPVNYLDSEVPDSFNGIAPIIGEGRYTRIRVQSGAATNIQGATIISEARDSV